MGRYTDIARRIAQRNATHNAINAPNALSPDGQSHAGGERQNLMPAPTEGQVGLVIWTDRDLAAMRRLLVLRQIELADAESRLSGDPLRDWYVRNWIAHMQSLIAGLKERIEAAQAEWA